MLKPATVDILTTFSSATSLDTFRISPDGKQVAISMNNHIYLVSFNRDMLRSVHSRTDLLRMKGCMSYTGSTLMANIVQEFRWGNDPDIAAWLFAGVDITSGKGADLIQIIRGVSTCDPKRVFRVDEFPATRFTPEDYGNDGELPDFDWNGSESFVFNTLKRNSGWGYLYSYDLAQSKGTKLDIFGHNLCCYRDARINPDGTYLFFAFQDETIAPKVVDQFYYIPIGQIGFAQFDPIPLPENFLFLNGKERAATGAAFCWDNSRKSKRVNQQQGTGLPPVSVSHHHRYHHPNFSSPCPCRIDAIILPVRKENVC